VSRSEPNLCLNILSVNSEFVPHFTNEGGARQILSQLAPWDEESLALAKSAKLQCDADIETAPLSRVDGITMWCTRSAGIHLDTAVELFIRWPDICPVLEIVKLDYENSLKVN